MLLYGGNNLLNLGVGVGVIFVSVGVVVGWFGSNSFGVWMVFLGVVVGVCVCCVLI